MDGLALVASHDRKITAIGIVGFAAALAAAAQVSIPVPGTSVPMTLEPLAVVLAGLWLGPRAGAASMALYLTAGAAGLPVFAPGGLPGIARLVGPTGGYLAAYPLAAFAAGWLAAKRSTFSWRLAAAALGIGLIHVGGIVQLTIITGSLRRAVMIGSLPFLGMDAVKALFAALNSPNRSRRAPV